MNGMLLTTVTVQPSTPTVGALDVTLTELIHASPGFPVIANPPLRTEWPVLQVAVSDEKPPLGYSVPEFVIV